MYVKGKLINSYMNEIKYIDKQDNNSQKSFQQAVLQIVEPGRDKPVEVRCDPEQINGFKVGEVITLQVYVRMFSRKNGGGGYNLQATKNQ